MNSPKVFISYSHDSSAHEARVLKLAEQLNQAGIDCMIDQYNPAPASGWPLWMEEQITAADFVLLICTEIYNQRVHRKDPGKGQGVCWEANLIYNLLYAEKLENEKFIPVLFKPQDEKYIPLPLQSYAFYSVDTKKGWEDLYRRLTKQPKTVKPETGTIIKLLGGQRQSSVFSVFESTIAETPSDCVHNLPLFNQAHHFGREEFLERIHRIFSEGASATLTQAITGLGGVGKTQIALAYAYTYKENYRYIWWVRAENPTTCDLDYQEFARRMELCGPEAERQEIIVKVREWQEKSGEWFFVYDNAMDYDALQEYLPRFPKGHMLITTRNNFFEIGNPLTVDVFDEEAAGEFLRFRTKRDEPDLSLELGRELGGLPLALEQAAAYIEKNHLTLQAYLELFRKYKLKLFSNTKPSNYNYTVETTWQISLEKITREATRQLLYFSAFLAPDLIIKQMFRDGATVLPQPLGETVADDIEFNEMLAELETYSLIRRNGDEFWSIHRLLQEVVRDSLDQERIDFVKNIMELFYQVYNFDYNQQKTWEKAGQLIPHMQTVVGVANLLQIENEELGWFCNEIGFYLFNQGRYEEAEPLYQRSMEIIERIFGLETQIMVTLLNNLALLYYNEGRYEEVEPVYKRALEIGERVLGPDHPDTAASLNGLSGLYKGQGRYEEAEPLCKRALEIRERVLGSRHRDTASSLNNLADLYNCQGRFEEAKPLYQRALEIKEWVLGPTHPSLATSLNNLAGLYENERRYEEAELLYQRTLMIYERTLGPDHPYAATTLNNLASLYKSQGRYKEVEPLLKRAWEILTKVLGKEHPYAQTCLRNLIGFYESQNQTETAQELRRMFAK